MPKQHAENSEASGARPADGWWLAASVASFLIYLASSTSVRAWLTEIARLHEKFLH